jgi:hypothetical protein
LALRHARTPGTEERGKTIRVQIGAPTGALAFAAATVGFAALNPIPAHAADTVVQGESLKRSSAKKIRIQSDAKAIGGATLTYRTSGSSASTKLVVGAKRLAIRVRGGKCDHAPHAAVPKAVVRIDGKRVMSVRVRHHLRYITLSKRVAIKRRLHKLTVSYPRSRARSRCDRNLHVDFVKFIGARRAAAPAAPAPAPAPASAAAAAGVVWTAPATRPMGEEWASYTEAGGNGTPTGASTSTARIHEGVFHGKPAYAMTVLAGDHDRYTTTAQRTELGQGNPGKAMPDGVDRRMYNGQDRWIAQQIFIPADAPTGNRSYGFYGLFQLKIDGSGGPAVGLSFEDGRFVIDRASSQGYGSTGQTDLWASSTVIPRNTWVKVLLHVKLSTGSDGILEAFGDLGDGQGYRQLMPTYRGWTLKYGSDGRPGVAHARMGIYRRAISQDTTIYFAGFNVSANRAAAEYAAGF